MHIFAHQESDLVSSSASLHGRTLSTRYRGKPCILASKVDALKPLQKY